MSRSIRHSEKALRHRSSCPVGKTPTDVGFPSDVSLLLPTVIQRVNVTRVTSATAVESAPRHRRSALHRQTPHPQL
ncbi:hypothetical protein T4A_2247 [Trichinella pseudospiralis]|uniref:Uncharacterized protein n=1 Tax=Trichinella pseudospiralis TaxID=6337 RepID=A0A0V1DU89_TRIPS|nr:hypothetical protein T4A_2247 [Trichinella pseudospiralis]